MTLECLAGTAIEHSEFNELLLLEHDRQECERDVEDGELAYKV